MFDGGLNFGSLKTNLQEIFAARYLRPMAEWILIARKCLRMYISQGIHGSHIAAYCGPPPPSGTVQLMNSCRQAGRQVKEGTDSQHCHWPLRPVLLRRFYRAAFAVNAVLRIDLQFHFSFCLLVWHIPGDLQLRHEGRGSPLCPI